MPTKKKSTKKTDKKKTPRGLKELSPAEIELAEDWIDGLVECGEPCLVALDDDTRH